MGPEPLTLVVWMLLLLPALEAASGGGVAHGDWCSRVCPEVKLAYPEPRCPQPVCPPPQCPQPSCPPLPAPSLSCPECPFRDSSFPETEKKKLPWKGLKSYNATYLGYYKFYSNMLFDWFDAQMTCEEDGAHLLIINSMQEDEFIRSNMNPTPGWIHVGVHDLIEEGQRMTVLGEPVNTTGFHRWLYGHQHPNIRNNCAWIKRTDTGMGMGPCHDKGPFVCELPVK